MLCKFYLNKAMKHTHTYFIFYLFTWYPASLSNSPILVAFVKITVSTGKAFLSKMPHFPHTKNVCMIQTKPRASDFRSQAWVLSMEYPKMCPAATRNSNFCFRGLGCQGQRWGSPQCCLTSTAFPKAKSTDYYLQETIWLWETTVQQSHCPV